MARELKHLVVVATFAAMSGATRRAHADGAPSSAAATSTAGVVRPRRSVLAAGAAIVPGIVVHGSGHFVAGDGATGRKLLALEGAGVATLAVGFVPLVLSGASRRIVGPAAALSVVGVGLFAISTLADLYGVLAPPGGFGAPFRLAPSIQTELGYRYVYDPVFSYRHFAFYEIDGRLGSWRAHPSAWFDLEGSASRVRVPIAFRFVGPTPKPAEPSIDGSYVEIETALTRHADLPDRFVTTTGELSVQGRLDLQRFAPSLAGSFAELGLGWALQRYGYEVKDVPADVGELLLGRFGYGVYVGWPGGPRGEAMLYYDHRHDDFAAGLKLSGIPSGVGGHFGFLARGFVSEHWGMSVEAMAGSAYVMGASMLFRQGGGP
jgi:hypothetical protein